MNILFMQWNGLGNEDMEDALIRCGHQVVTARFDASEVHSCKATENIILNTLQKNNINIVFSFNYFPVISKICAKTGIDYYSWVYDSPAVLLYNYTLINPINHIFIFDKEQYLELKNNGINTVYYMPLAANPTRLSALLNDPKSIYKFKSSRALNKTDIAFVGSLYNEAHNFYDRMTGISDYTRGYLEGIMASQHNIYGCNFVSKLLKPNIISDMVNSLGLKPDSEGIETNEFLYAEYVINRKLTSMERHDFLSSIGKHFKFDLYTNNASVSIPGAINHGLVDYLDMAPFVYNQAKINLNISLRSIHTGIPLRAFEIIGCGGFLLSNYQSDFNDCFINGEDYITYMDEKDLVDKISYFLSHESERKAIAQNGYDKLCNNHTYDHRVREMFA